MTKFKLKSRKGIGLAIYSDSTDPTPLTDPLNNVQKLRFHSQFNYYEAASGFPVDVPITHVAVTADPGTIIDAPINNVTSYTSIVATDYKLADHNLGYTPNFMVSVGGVQYPAGCPIQIGGAGARRSICFWVDTTSIYVRDSARPSIYGLSAISITYHVVVFRDPSPIGSSIINFRTDVPRLRMGYGSVDTNERAMREPDVGETPYAIPTGETMDLQNGRARYALPDGSVFDIGPSMGVNAYNGSFFGGPSKKVAI